MCPSVTGGDIVFMIAYILRPSCFYEISALCVSWIISNQAELGAGKKVIEQLFSDSIS